MDKDSDMEGIDDGEEIIMDDDDDDDDEEEDNENIKEIKHKDKEVYLPGKQLEKDEELVCDESAYIMLHSANTGAPCLSFDVIPDSLGDSRDKFPMTAYIVCGTQAANTHVNNLIVMKMSNLHRTSREKTKEEEEEDSSSDESSDDDDDEEEKNAKMQCALIKHSGCVNRVRSTKFNDSVFSASWSELGRVNIWNLNRQLEVLEDEDALTKYEKEETDIKPIFTFTGHQQEGFGLDWSKTSPGVLASGDCRRDIHIWQPTESGWKVDQRPLIGHKDSVEDLQWSPNEQNVLASCSVDKSIRIWDCRAAPSKACMLVCDNCHESDINVISWNKNEPLIASGGDDGILNIWDLRQFQTKTPIATFKHHTNHVTSVEWHPTDSTVLATGGADDQIALWDLSVEKDTENTIKPISNEAELNQLPPQLLFIHQGQSEIKELHWHPQLPGIIMSTAHSGFNIFKTISV